MRASMNFRLAFLVAFLLGFATAATAGEKPWIEVRSPHFRVITDSSQDDGRQVALQFEQMRSVLADTYPTFRLEGGAPLLILAARDEQTAKSLEPGYWKVKGAKPAGAFHHAWEREYAMVRIDALTHGQLDVVYHEYTHTVLHLNMRWIPTWLDEGLAEYYGYTRFERRQIFIGAPPPPYQMPGYPLIPIETLISVNPGSPYYHDEDKVHRFYAESWALVHFMMFGPGMDGGKRLNQFAGLLQQGMEQKKAFQETFGPFADMDKALYRYLETFAFKAGVVPHPPQIDEKTFRTRTLTMAETEAELSAFHLWSHDLADARPLAERALKDDPRLGLAHEIMGFLDFSEGKDADALNEFSQASDLDPTLTLALFAKTMMSPIATSTVPSDQDAFQSSLLKVLKSNSQFAPAYVQLARLSLGRDDLKNAFGLSDKAERLEPMRAGYHLLSGRILLRMGKGSDAASYARFVAERWRGPDHDEALELWNAVPTAELPADVSFIEPLPKDIQTMEGQVVSSTCAASTGYWGYTISSEGRTFTFRHKGGAPLMGFPDTLWYIADHLNLCHHLEGMRAMVRYKPAADSSYTGDPTEIELRDDLPSLPPAAKEASDTRKPTAR
jgi:Tfp pilus assembly protein PilF